MRSSWMKSASDNPRRMAMWRSSRPFIRMDFAIGQSRLKLKLEEHPPDIGPAQTLRS